MDEDKDPTIQKLIRKIWARYQVGSHRHGIKPRNDLGASINASLTSKFDYRAYLLELPRCPHLVEERPDLMVMSESNLMQIPRDEAMRLIAYEIRSTLMPRVNAPRRSAAMRVREWLDITGGQSHIPV